LEGKEYLCSYTHKHLQRPDWQIFEIDEVTIGVTLLTGMSSTTENTTTLILEYSLPESWTQDLRCYWTSCNHYTICPFAIGHYETLHKENTFSIYCVFKIDFCPIMYHLYSIIYLLHLLLYTNFFIVSLVWFQCRTIILLSWHPN